MTRRIVRTILVVLSVATLYMSLAPEASAQTCSLATVAGSWAATLIGTILFPAPTGPVPAAAVLSRKRFWHGGEKCGRWFRQ